MSLEERGNYLFALAKHSAPKQSDIVKIVGYADFKVGEFWNNIKQGKNADLYRDVLSKNEILRADYEKTKKNREQRMEVKVMSLEERGNYLFAFKHVPKQSDIVKIVGCADFKVGQFWSYIKGGKKPDLYINVLSKNEILRADYEKTKKDRDQRIGVKDRPEEMESIEIESEQINYDIMTVPMLLKLCKDRGLTRYSGRKKADLINMLSN